MLGVLYAVGAAAVFSTAGVIVRRIELPAWDVSFWRSALLVATMLPLLFWQRRGLLIDVRNAGRALLLSATLPAAAGALAACGPASGEAPAPAGKTTTVTYMIYAGEEERRAWEATKEGFERAHPDLKKFIASPDNSSAEPRDQLQEEQHPILISPPPAPKLSLPPKPKKNGGLFQLDTTTAARSMSLPEVERSAGSSPVPLTFPAS